MIDQKLLNGPTATAHPITSVGALRTAACRFFHQQDIEMNGFMNKQVRLAKRPEGPLTADIWRLTSEPIRELAEGEFLTEAIFISLDPAMRMWINEGDTYVPGVGVGEVMRASVIARVLASRNPDFSVGSHVAGRLGVQEFSVSDGNDMIGQAVISLEATKAPLSSYLGVLGVPGLTAYFGLLEVGRPKKGDTVVVSGATGAVGSVVGQIARIKGCRVIGIAGGPDKCRYLTESLGFDGAIDYLNDNVQDGLRKLCPGGINVYFDNVGGDILDAALSQLAMHGSVVLCGSMSQYSNTGPIKGPSNYRALLVKRGRMEGIIVYDYISKYELARAELAKWLEDGSLISKEDFMTGIESFPEALSRTLAGKKFGKMLIRLKG